MKGFSEKIFLSLKMPTEEQPVSDHRRLELALQELGYHPVQLPLHILRRLYPLCRRAEFDVTATLVHRENERVVTDMQLPPIPDFLIRMQAAKFIPHTDMGCFPSVQSGKGEFL